MAALFQQLFTREQGLGRRPSYSLQKLQALHDRLQSILETDESAEAVEVIRSMTEALLWGEQNDDNDQFFDFFCENSILSDFVQILGRNVPKTVKVQLLQSLSMLIQNIRRPTSLYYLFSNNYVNQLIATQFDWSDEEILSYYISFLKSLALRLNQETVKFFFNERSQQFPLFTEAIRFFSHRDQMVRTSVRNMTLRVFRLDDEAMQRFVLRVARPYFQRLSEYLALLWCQLEEARGSSAMEEANDEQQDLLMYICDVLELNNQQLNVIVVQQFLQHACYPFLLHSVWSDAPELLSCRTALFLFHEIFQGVQRRDVVEPLALALLSDGDDSGAVCSAPRRPEILEVWEPFKVEDDPKAAPSEPPLRLRGKMLQLLRSEEALLTAGVFRSCLSLGISNLLPSELLVDTGLLPPVPRSRPTTPATPLEVLLMAAEALENHSAMSMLVVQALCRLCMDVAFTPQARSLSGAKDWTHRPKAAVGRAMQGAARQVRSFIHNLGDAFLDIFAEVWDLDHEAAPLPELCKATLSLATEKSAAESDSQQAFKAVRVMLMLRRLHSDLSEGGGSPRHGGYRAAAPVATGAEGGGIIDSALTPLSGSESPLQIPEEEFNTLGGNSFQLGRMDRIVCGIVTPEGRHSRYMILHHYLLLLVQPDILTPGYAVVKTLVPLRYVEPLDCSDPRQLCLKAKNLEEPGESMTINLTFEDTKRCSIAESHLMKHRKQVRERLCKKVLDFTEKLCEAFGEAEAS